MMFPNEPPAGDSGSLPDINTSEAILYGPAYFRIKSMQWAWDEMEDTSSGRPIPWRARSWTGNGAIPS